MNFKKQSGVIQHLNLCQHLWDNVDYLIKINWTHPSFSLNNKKAKIKVVVRHLQWNKMGQFLEALKVCSCSAYSPVKSLWGFRHYIIMSTKL